jgi:hypothetical protein
VQWRWALSGYKREPPGVVVRVQVELDEEAEAARLDAVAARCVENAIKTEGIRVFSNPGIKVVYLIMAMSRMGTPYYLRKEALTAGECCS